jgi:UDP-N-acetylmuramate dehydrogenase
MNATVRSEHDMARLRAAKAALAAIAPVREHEPLARHTTFGIGGPADLFITVHTAGQLADAFVTARRHGLPVFVLGSGSNILVGDRGIRGLVIENRARAVRAPAPLPDGRALVVAESGVSFAALARRLCRDGYAGLEWAVGIPGTLGGAVVYNAGAYGGALVDVLVSARVVDAEGHEREVGAAELGLEYRSSAFTRGVLRDQVVLTATLAVTPGDRDALLRRVAELDAKRLATQPRGRNAGSIFKNPPHAAAWRLIDQVGLRGHRIGDAEISAKHANFFCNAGRATAAEVRQLIELAERRVRERFGIELEREVQLVGEF